MNQIIVFYILKVCSNFIFMIVNPRIYANYNALIIFKRVSWMECVAISITDAIWSPYSFSCPADCPGLYCTVKNHFSVIKGFLVNRYYLTIIRTR